ncbi:MAG: DUF2807 domain-containing protein [Bacteroidetes bacterium]|nr:DUF2807 domain-containing protein [Bacteroidota bacterium]
MKTSNKLLLGALLVALLGITISVFLMKSVLNKTLIIGKGNLIEKTIDVNDFTNLNIAGNYKIYYTQDDSYAVKIIAEENIINLINVFVEEETLKTSSDSMIVSSNISIYVTAPNISNLILTAGSSFIAGFIATDEIKVTANGGVNLDINGTFSEFNLFLNAGADAIIKGNSKRLSVLANAGSSLQAKEFEVLEAELTASSGSTLEVNAINTLSVESSSGSSVIYYGNPELKNIITSSGGTFQKREKN